MPETYTVNPLSREPSEKDKQGKEKETSKEDPHAAHDITLFCLTYIFCCIPVLLESVR